MMGGMIAGPVIAGVSYDTTGSYEFGFTLLAILAAFGSLFFVFATKPQLPEPDAAPETPLAAVPPIAPSAAVSPPVASAEPPAVAAAGRSARGDG